MLSSFKSKIGRVYCPVYILELLTSVFRIALPANLLTVQLHCQINCYHKPLQLCQLLRSLWDWKAVIYVFFYDYKIPLKSIPTIKFKIRNFGNLFFVNFWLVSLLATSARHPVTPATNENTLELAISGVPYFRILNMIFGIAFTCLLVTRQLTILHCKCNMSIASHIHELQKVQALS